MRGLLKLTLLSALHRSGLLWAYSRVRLRGKAIVLTYHRVLPRERQRHSFSTPAIVVTPETFSRHMEFVRQHLRPVSAAQFVELLKSGAAIPPRTCLVTFDDGWYDNLEFALPVLKQHGIPAVLFIATEHVGSRNGFWQERLASLLFRAWQQREGSAGLFQELGEPEIAAFGEQDARKAIHRLVASHKSKSPEEVQRLLAEVGDRVTRLSPREPASSAAEDRFLTWQEVSELQASGIVSIESHAMTHVPLTALAGPEVDRELQGAKAEIRERLRHTPDTLAYPNGNFNEDVAMRARAAGYELAFTTERGHVTPRSNRMQLPRINVHEAAASTPAAFFGRIVGLF
jgi:peptidoglycan/xylan/chitin deacetylase (PgdA/CDA1 family)